MCLALQRQVKRDLCPLRHAVSACFLKTINVLRGPFFAFSLSLCACCQILLGSVFVSPPWSGPCPHLHFLPTREAEGSCEEATGGPGLTIKGLWLALAFFFNYALESN